jgi:NAD dependent epimerase/dehydratase family enzyme
LRFGIVLGKEKGAFPRFAKPLSYGILPILGSGKQTVSWIEVTDLARLILFALENEQLSGIYNAVAPNPVSQKKLMETIAGIKGGVRIPVPVPAFVLKILLGGMSVEILKSCTVSADATLASGFHFNYPEINSVVSAILNRAAVNP